MSLQSKIPKKVDLKPKKHHGFHLILVLFGIVMPPIAVALRFGVCTDLWINIVLTICGYIPSHVHNFYIQNIRNNENRGRTPKWALKAGVVDTDNLERRKRKNAWAGRYDERNLESAHIGQALEEGEEGDNYIPTSEAERERLERRRHEGLWGDHDEEFYNDDRDQRAPNQRHWHYPANFEGTNAARESRRDDGPSSRGSVDSITGASAYPTTGGIDDDVPEWGKDYGSAKKSNSRKRFGRKKSKQTVGDWTENGNGNATVGHGYADEVARDDGWSGGRSGGGVGRSNGSAQPAKSGRNGDPNWEHEF